MLARQLSLIDHSDTFLVQKGLLHFGGIEADLEEKALTEQVRRWGGTQPFVKRDGGRIFVASSSLHGGGYGGQDPRVQEGSLVLGRPVRLTRLGRLLDEHEISGVVLVVNLGEQVVPKRARSLSNLLAKTGHYDTPIAFNTAATLRRSSSVAHAAPFNSSNSVSPICCDSSDFPSA